MGYGQVYQESWQDPVAFWGSAAKAITWDVEPSLVFDDEAAPFYKWFPDGMLNTCFSAVDPNEVVGELVEMVRSQSGPAAALKTVTVVERLPKTRSGKILRGTMRQIADGEEWKMPATIDDPVILDEIGAALSGMGYPRSDS